MFSIQSALTSPQSEFSLQAQGKNFPTASLGSSEANLLQNQLNDILMAVPSSVVRDLIMQRQDVIASAAAFSKQVFDEKLFGGLNAGDNEIGFDILRPGHIRSDPSSGSQENDWYFDPGTTGWVDWIGDGSTNNYTGSEDQVSVVLGFIDQDTSTEVSGMNIEEFGRNVDMLPKDLNGMRLRDNDTEQQVEPLPSLILQENDDVHTKLRYDRNVESQPRLLGFTFGLGTFLDNEDY